MFCKIRNILSVSALALMVTAGNNNLYAQGVVTLSEDAMFDDNDSTPSASVPDNAPLFGSDNAASTAAPKVEPKAEPTVEPVAAAEVPSPIMPASMLNQPGAGVGIIGTNDNEEIGDEVFSKMSNLEKQTALLNLELRREKVQNEIEAIKNQRKQAIIQE